MGKIYDRTINIAFYCIIGVAGIMIILPILFLLIGIAVIAFEDKIIEEDLNSPYINSGYVGWQEVALDGDKSCMLPGDWTLRQEGQLVYITNEAGAQIACGAYFDNAYATFESEEDFLMEVVSISEPTYEHVCNVHSSNYGRLTDSKDLVAYYARLYDMNSPELFLYFPPETVESYTDLEDILAAIIFSHQFPEA